MTRKHTNVEAIYPLSPVQQGLLFHTLYDAEAGLYVEQFCCTIAGDLDIAAFQRAWRRMVERHAALRTLFVWERRAEPLQVVRAAALVDLPWEYQDWRGQPQDEQAARLDAFLRADRERGFDLGKAPLLRLALIQTGAARYAFVASHHHLLLDGWSQALLLTEVFACYRAFRRGQEPDLAPARPYREYIAWLQRQDLAAAEAFWRRALAGFVAPTPLGVDRRAAPGSAGPEYAERAVALAPQATAALQTFARQNQLTLNTLVQGAWALLLSRYSREADVLFGAVITSRPAALPGVEQMIGLFINTLPVRAQLPIAARILPWLKQIQARQADALAYEYTPLAQIRAWSDAPRDLPLFESIVAFENIPADASIFAQAGDLAIRDVRYLERTNYPLVLRATPGEQLALRVIYDAGRFDAPTIARLIGHLATALEGFAADPARRLADLSLLTEAERRQMLVEWNSALPEVRSQEACLHDLFADQAARSPDAVAIVFPVEPLDERRTTNDESAPSSFVLGPSSFVVHLSYSALNARANRLAHHLRRMGVGPEDPVALLLEPSIELVVAILGVLKAGAAYLPINPAYPPERIRFMLEDAGARVVVTNDERRTTNEGANPAFVLGPSSFVVLRVDWPAIAAQPDGDPRAGARPDNLAYIIYTSGSTGAPKGVAVGHRQVARLFAATQAWFEFGPRDVWTLFHSAAFDFSVWEIWGSLLYGGRLVVTPYLVSRQPHAFHALLYEQQATVLNQTPTAFRQLAQADAAHPRPLRLRLVIFGGEALDIAGLQPWFARHGDRAPQLVNMYGITETTVHVTYRPLTSADAQASGSRIGRRIPDLQLYILDPATLQPAPIGVAGEIHVGGAGLARGYLGRPDLTAERFVPNPFFQGSGVRGQGSGVRGQGSGSEPRSLIPDPRLYRTGDLARYLADGDIEYLGRVDQQVKVRGFRIEPGEIAAALERHPAVREALALAREDAPGDRRLVAYVVKGSGVRDQGSTDPASDALNPDPRSLIPALRAFLAARLPDYMLPAAIIALDEWPLTPNGKIDRRALPAPDRAPSASNAGYVAPRTPEEQILAEVWAEALGVDRVGVYDNFFALGGDSIRSLRVLSLARERGLDLSLQQLFRHQSPYALGQALGAAQAGGALLAPEPFSLVGDDDRARLPADVEDAYPLTLLQRGMLFHSAYSQAGAIYHDVFSFHLRAPLDRTALAAALGRLAARHPVLRTSFDLQRYSAPLQLVHRAAAIPFAFEDLSELPAPEQEAAHAAWLAAEQRRPFDWAAAPLLRLHIHRRGDGSFHLSLSFHHAILDGWSVASLLTELFQLYFAELGRDTRPIPAPPAPLFREFVALERAILASEEAQRSWADRLDQAAPGALPRWSDSGLASERQIGVHAIVLPAQITDALHDLARSASAPLKSVLLAAHLRVMRLLLGADDVTTGLVMNGRPEQPDGERALGLFLNTLPLHMALGGGTWRDLVRAAFAAEQDLLPLRRYPLAEIQRRAAAQPLFEAAFNFVHFHVYQGLRQFADLELLSPQFFEETNFPLVVNFSQEPGAAFVQLRLNYDRATLCDVQAEAIGGYYLRALGAMAAAPDARYEAASLLSDQERRQLLLDWNATDAAYPRNQGVHELFAEQAARSPDAVALVFDEPTRDAGSASSFVLRPSSFVQLTYGELEARANRLARRLRALGVGPGACVGVFLERSAEMIVAFVGILKAGAVYVPLDPGYPAERLSFMIGDAQASFVLTQRSLAAALPDGAFRALVLGRDWPASDEAAVAPPARPATGLHSAYAIYTSGSTGAPKGVLVPHRAIARLVLNTNYIALTKADRVAQASSATFDAATFEIWGALLNGAALVGVSRQAALSPWEFAAQMRAQRISAMFLTTSLFNQIVRESPAAFGSLDTLLVGGEALDPQWIRAALLNGPPRRILNGYGPTESTTFALWFHIQHAPDEGGIPIGRPIANTRAYLLDRRMDPVPVGVAGELYLGGDGLALGYLHRPDLTAERFVPNPFTLVGSSQDAVGSMSARADCRLPTADCRLYKTGDLARYRPDGAIEFLGRIDGQIKLRGFRIEAGEIAAALRLHPAVQESAVLLREDAPGDKRLVAYVVKGSGARDQGSADPASAALTPDPRSLIPALRAFLAARLPDYMIPSAFVELDALPLNSSGKVDRAALPRPDHARPADGPPYADPRTPAEARLAEIWSAVLGIAQVGIHDNFFELGGHSLLALQVIAQIRAAFDADLPLRRLFELPTIAELAGELAAQPDPQPRAESPRPAIAPRRRRSIDQQLDDLRQISDDDARRLLGAPPKSD